MNFFYMSISQIIAINDYKSVLITVFFLLLIIALLLGIVTWSMVVNYKSKKELNRAYLEVRNSFRKIDTQGKRIHDLLYYDELTGLYNRTSSLNHLKNAIDSLDGEVKVVVMLLDVDNFKNINDTYGHRFGDDVIKTIGMKLKQLKGESIHVGRFSGDEFIVIMKGVAIDGEVRLAVEWIKELFDKTVEVNGSELFLAASIGISNTLSGNQSVWQLIQKADAALHKAKDLGKNQHVHYSDALLKQKPQNVKLQASLKKALENGEFYLVYQPYFDIKTKKVLGFEALLRWKKQAEMDVQTIDIIRGIEEMGLIVEVGDWVLTQVCKFVQSLDMSVRRTLCVSVNVSTHQLMRLGFSERLLQLIQMYGISPQNLCLEMTETVMIESMEFGANMLQRLKDCKFKIAIDDFGTGYSSLNYFKRLPLDILKLDKSFIDQIQASKFDYSLVASMIQLSHQKGLVVIAEGVETQSQGQILLELGCDVAQGYYYSKPLSENEILKQICV